MKNEDILKLIDERDLHCVLNKFCVEHLNIQVKTIFHERSTKNKGKAEWLHPDMVGLQLTTSNWDSNIIEVCKNFYVSKAILYSFELKKSICMDSLREYYFQAVSNSSWANEGYLVTASLDENDTELMNEIKRLVGAFGIGIIKLNILNPKDSTILFSAKRKEALDGETMNKLYSINPDYRDFIQVVTNSLKINHLVNQYWDNISMYDTLIKKINYISDTKEISKQSTVKKSIIKEAKKEEVKENNFITVNTTTDGKEINNVIPKILHINDYQVSVKSWRDIYISTCEYLYEKFKEDFVTSALSIPYKTNMPFSYNESDINGKAIFIKNAKLYTGGNHSGDGFMWMLNRLLNTANFNVNIFIEGTLKFNNLIEKEISFNERNIKIKNSKPLVCKIQDNEYIPKNWYDLIVLIYNDLKNKDPELYDDIIKSSTIFTVESIPNSYYDKTLNLYAKAMDAKGKFKEIQLILTKCNIPLEDCSVRYEQKTK